MIMRILLEYTNKTNYKRISIMISLDQILNLHHISKFKITIFYQYLTI